ncbi:MAG TPA: Rrf2 family transcriptional regulator, partial [Ilumatobacteraceae bacterium]|nr:Rrf2 family transcriptional regulator [Ilumatobacteraceae bacterium]
MRITRKADYAVRAMVALARANARYDGVVIPRDLIATQETIPPAYLDDILRKLRNGGLVRSCRGVDGGWSINLDPAEITVGDVLRVMEGP